MRMENFILYVSCLVTGLSKISNDLFQPKMTHRRVWKLSKDTSEMK